MGLSNTDFTDVISFRCTPRNCCSFLVLLTLGFGTLKAEPVQTEFFVSLNGSDTNPGTQAAPFKSLEKARDTIRLVQRNDLNVNIWIEPGEYILPNQIDFDERDGGRGCGTVTYQAHPGTEVLLSGGTPITGWQEGENNIWKAPLDRGVKLRSLYVNGVRARMAGMMGLAIRAGEFHVTSGQAPWAWSTV